MDKLPKISIVTPSYNQGHFLEETILSVIGQNYPNLEYIIIDGGSKDDSVKIIKKYEKYLTFWISEKDKGQSHAINKGFSKATGDILGWLNSDDLFFPSTLSYISSLLKPNNRTSLFFGNCTHFKETDNGLQTWGSNVVKDSDSNTLESRDYIIQPSSFWTKNVWELVGPLREDIHYAFDWEWFLRAKSMGVNFHSLHKCFSLYRIHGEHKTANGGKARQNEILKIYQTYSTKNARLYKLISEESLNFSTFSARLMKNKLRILKKPTSYGNILKHLKGDKYKAFSYSEIDSVMSML